MCGVCGVCHMCVTCVCVCVTQCVCLIAVCALPLSCMHFTAPFADISLAQDVATIEEELAQEM